MLYAHIFKLPKSQHQAHPYKPGMPDYFKYELYLTNGPSLADIHSRELITGKAEARRIAKYCNAKPWNF